MQVIEKLTVISILKGEFIDPNNLCHEYIENNDHVDEAMRLFELYRIPSNFSIIEKQYYYKLNENYVIASSVFGRSWHDDILSIQRGPISYNDAVLSAHIDMLIFNKASCIMYYSSKLHEIEFDHSVINYILSILTTYFGK